MAVRHSPNLQAHTSPPGSKNLRMDQAMAGRELLPEFEYDFTSRTDATSFNIVGMESTSGTSQIRLPYWVADYRTLGNPSISQAIHIETEPWEINLIGTGLNLTTRQGGRLDALPLVQGWYWIYAFFDDREPANNKFQGIGVLRRPAFNYVDLGPGGAGVKGGTPTILFSGNFGSFYAPNARVLLQETPIAIDTLGGSTASNAAADCTYPTDGSAYNQGVITSTELTKIGITLDNANIIVNTREVGYGITLPSGVVTGRATQISHPAPFIPGPIGIIPFLFPATLPAGGGFEDIVEFEFCYLGSVYVDNQLRIGMAPRKRGDIVYFPFGETLLLDETINETTFFNRHAARRVPVHGRKLEVETTFNRVSGGGEGSLLLHPSENERIGMMNAGETPANTSKLRILRDEVEMAPFSASLSIECGVSGSGDMRMQVDLRGYKELRW